jgi:SAM-dependent methyltransferase
MVAAASRVAVRVIAWWRVGARWRSSLSRRTARFPTLDAWRRSGVAADQARGCAAFVARATPTMTAWCGLCARQVVIASPRVVEGGAPNLREALVCPRCRLNARARAALGLMRDTRRRPRIYVTEQASPVYVWLRHEYDGVLGSEYRMPDARRFALEDWLRDQGAPGAIAIEDVTALTHADASVDVICSFDVLEHVPDYRQALREFARVLRPGGDLWLTVPFLDDRQDTVVRARLGADGDVEHLLSPEIHGDPLSGGVLCYYHFGWDLLDAARAAGFGDAAWCRTWAPAQALFGLWTLHARR